MFVLGVALDILLVFQAPNQEGKEVPVTIKELDLSGAIREFQDFQQRLGEFHERIGKGREIARETASIL